ncbi:hypothetical protein HPB49_001065 [Dermacentor silvarum]|uniref:Uncharacterized protein n=1 Tax=Dermacentor silvarum TaxID=543639 RepID=A0ACB8CUH8_DERSI|nr:hypothetical protein HPB49_001065 [Dermacentor silvarum]
MPAENPNGAAGDDASNQRLHFVERLASVPLVAGVFDIVSQRCAAIKASSPLLSAALSASENVGAAAIGCCEHVLRVGLGPQLEHVDALACRGIEKLEQCCPVALRRPDEIAADVVAFGRQKVVQVQRGGLEQVERTRMVIVAAVHAATHPAAVMELVHDHVSQPVNRAFNNIDEVLDLIFYTMLIATGICHVNSALHSPVGFTLILLLLSFSGLCVIFSGVLLLGLYLDNRLLLIPWLAVVSMTTLLDIVLSLYFIADLKVDGFVVAMYVVDYSLCSVNIYCIMCVLSQYQEYAVGRRALGGQTSRVPLPLVSAYNNNSSSSSSRRGGSGGRSTFSRIASWPSRRMSRKTALPRGGSVRPPSCSIAFPADAGAAEAAATSVGTGKVTNGVTRIAREHLLIPEAPHGYSSTDDVSSGLQLSTAETSLQPFGEEVDLPEDIRNTGIAHQITPHKSCVVHYWPRDTPPIASVYKVAASNILMLSTAEQDNEQLEEVNNKLCTQRETVTKTEQDQEFGAEPASPVLDNRPLLDTTSSPDMIGDDSKCNDNV